MMNVLGLLAHVSSSALSLIALCSGNHLIVGRFSPAKKPT